jgi:hypothetical protein
MARTWSLFAACALFWHAAQAQDNCVLSASGNGDDGPALAQALNDCSLVEVPEGVTLNISTLLNTSTLADTTLVSSS